ncbi:MAG TPA: hypothetical protein VGE45_01885 [Chloroflexia bacterium]|jgi:hypothetical protein
MLALDDIAHGLFDVARTGDNAYVQVIASRVGTWHQDRPLIIQSRSNHIKRRKSAQAALHKHRIRLLINPGWRCPYLVAENLYKKGCPLLDELQARVDIYGNGIDWACGLLEIGQKLEAQYNDWLWDWSHILLMRNGRVEAASRLLDKYIGHIEKLARRFEGMCPALADDLFQEAWIHFHYRVLPSYDPTHGATLWEYASVALQRKLRDVCLKWSHASRWDRTPYKLVQDTLQDLRGRLEREPADTEVAQECRLALAEVQEILDRDRLPRTVSLDLAAGGSSIRPPKESDVPSALIEFMGRQSQLDEIVRFLNEDNGGSDGVKWLSIYALKLYEKHTWADILLVLDDAQPIEWATVHARYRLPSSVPTHWPTIRALFDKRPPTLNVESMKKWFRRRTDRLLSEFKPAPRS